MAVCLDYQSVYGRREGVVISVRMQIGLAVLLVGVLAVKVWARAEITSVGYDLGKERQRAVGLDLERRELELERSVLLRPDVLEREARSRLGLQPLRSQQARKLRW